MSRPHALVVTPRFPWPLDDGGRIGLYQTVWSASRSYETTLLSLVPEDEMDRPVPEAIASLGVEVVRVAHRPPWQPVALLQGAFGRWPYMLARYRNARFDAAIREAVTRHRPEFALINHLHMATYIDALGDVPAVLRAHNLEHRWLSRYAERLKNPAARLYAFDQVRQMERAEAELCSRCAMVLAIQEEEASLLRRLAPGTPVETLPLGIDTRHYRPRSPQSPPVVAMVGSWDWAPNADGARVFLEKGWSLVRSRIPAARLRLVGKRASPALARVAERAGAEVAGYVEDMAVEFARASVMVVPLWMGSGVRVKIVEALAAGLPVVSTTLGAEGLDLSNGEHVMLADTPLALAGAVIDLLEHPIRAEGISAAGRELMERRWSLDAVGRQMTAFCAAAASADRSGSRPARIPSESARS